MTTFASVRERNHSSPRHSSWDFPLKLSATPFCQGLPGSISAVPIPCATIHDSRALDTNSGPLSRDLRFGTRAEPFEPEAFIVGLSVEAFGDAVLPGLAR